jgi:D-alanine-D-alanine ligase
LKQAQNSYAPEAYGKVAVLMGGLSAERNISLESGQAVYKSLQRKEVDAHAIDVDKNILAVLQDGGFDRVFIALHGRGGEDGSMQGALDILNMPYSGSGVLGSALAMDKSRTKKMWESYGLPTPPFVELSGESDWKQVSDTLGLPLMVKPVHEGSSLGASKVTSVADMEEAWRVASQFEDRVMAERWIVGCEYTAPILGERVLPLIRLETPREFYDYQAKYTDDTTRYICPCGLTEKQEELIGKLSMKAFTSLGASGWGRVDLMIDQQKQPWLIEANTIPGMTSHSLVPMAAKQAGMSFDDLVMEILNTSMRQQQ